MSDPWVRLLLVAAGVIGAALLLKVLPAFLVLALFVLGVAALARVLKQRSEREAVEGRAGALGLRREAHDPFGLRALSLSLFERAPEGAIEGVLWGTWRGVEVRAFDLAFGAALPGGASVRRVFSCALGQVGGSMPAVVVEPRSFLTMLPEPPALDPLEVTGGRFADLFDVRGADAGVARSVLDERVRGWLLGLDEAWGFEVHERAVLVYGPRPDRADAAVALDVLVGLLDRLPGSVRSGLGSAGTPPAASGPGAPGDAGPV